MDSVYEFLMKDVHIKYGDTVVAAVSGPRFNGIIAYFI